jgi:hypothetical protein
MQLAEGRADCDKQNEGTSPAVADGVPFRVYATHDYQSGIHAPPFSTPMLVAVGWALMKVPSITNVLCAPCSAARDVRGGPGRDTSQPEPESTQIASARPENRSKG